MGWLEALATLVFWGSLATVAYVYAGYPITLMLLPRRPSRRSSAISLVLPRVTVVIAAFNERVSIRPTVQNKLDQDYPAGLLDVVVVSDASTDGTDDIVQEMQASRVTLLRNPRREGKTAALNRAMTVARGEIVVFSDANSLYAPDAVARLVACFEDPDVGYVTGRLEYGDGGSAVGSGSGLYMRYENWVRRLETRAGSVIGVNGGIDAVRRLLYEPMRPDHLPDFMLPLRVAARGLRVVYSESAVSYEEALGQQADEYRMRIRVTLRALRTLAEMRSLLRPRHGLLAFELMVHKVLRYLVAFLLAAMLLSGLLLAGSAPYAWMSALQGAMYGAAAVGWLAGGRIRWRPVFVPFYFCLINVAAAAACIRYLQGQQQVIWTPRTGA